MQSTVVNIHSKWGTAGQRDEKCGNCVKRVVRTYRRRGTRTDWGLNGQTYLKRPNNLVTGDWTLSLILGKVELNLTDNHCKSWIASNTRTNSWYRMGTLWHSFRFSPSKDKHHIIQAPQYPFTSSKYPKCNGLGTEDYQKALTWQISVAITCNAQLTSQPLSH